MAKYTNTIEYQLKTKVDLGGINQLKSNLNQITQEYRKLGASFNVDETAMKRTLASIEKIDKAFDKAFDPTTGLTNMKKLQDGMKGISIAQLEKDFSKFGTTGKNATIGLVSELGKMETGIKTMSSSMDKMINTLGNTARWAVSASLIQTLSNRLYDAVQYVQDLDRSLNDIRIVTGESAKSMREFTFQANEAAKALGQTTVGFTNASLIFAQQGYSLKASADLAALTLKTANVTGQETAEVSEQLTSLLNGFQINGNDIAAATAAVDKLAKVAAVGAADLEELATAESKVASTANTLGVSQDQLVAQLSTIISVTRQAPENVGNAMKTIYARLGDLKMGETLEDGTDLGQIGITLEKIGVSLLDTTGNMRNMGDVIEDLMGKWDGLNTAEKQAVAVKLAGKYQYNNLLALLENSRMYNEQLQASYDSLGTINEQQEIYMESLEGKTQQLTSAFEGLFSTIADPDAFKPFISALTTLVEKFDMFIQAIGGTGGALQALAPIALSLGKNVLSENMINAMSNARVDIMKKQNAMTTREILRERGLGGQIEGLDQFAANIAGFDSILPFMSEAQREQYESLRIGVANAMADFQAAKAERENIHKNIASLWSTYGFKSDEILDKNGKLNLGLLENIKGQDPAEFAVQFKDKQGIIGNYWSAASATQGLSKSAYFGEPFDKNDLSELEKYNNVMYQELMSVANNKDIKEKDRSSALLTVLEKARLDSIKLANQEVQKIQADTTDAANALAEEDKARINMLNALDAQRTQLIEAHKQAQIRAIMSVASAAGILASAWTSFQNLGSIWANEDLEFGDKLLQTFQNLGFVLPMIIGGISEMRNALKSLDSIDFQLLENANERLEIEEMTGKAKDLADKNEAKTQQLNVQGNNNNIAMSGNGPASVNDNGTDTKKKDEESHSSADKKDEGKDGNKDKTPDTTVIPTPDGKETPKEKKAKKAWSERVIELITKALHSTSKFLKKWLPKVLKGFGPLLIAGLVGSAIKGVTENFYKKQIEEDIKKTSEKYEEAKTKADDYTASNNTVQMLMEQYRATGEASEEFKNTLKEVGESFGIQGAEAMVAVGAYEELADAINKSAEAAREDARAAGKDAKEALERGIDNEAYLPTVVGSALGVGDRLLLWAEQFVSKIADPMLTFLMKISEAITNFKFLFSSFVYKLFSALDNSILGGLIPDSWVNYFGDKTIQYAQEGLTYSQELVDRGQSQYEQDILFYTEEIEKVNRDKQFKYMAEPISASEILRTTSDGQAYMRALVEDGVEDIASRTILQEILGFTDEDMKAFFDPVVSAFMEEQERMSADLYNQADTIGESELPSLSEILENVNYLIDHWDSIGGGLDLRAIYNNNGDFNEYRTQFSEHTGRDFSSPIYGAFIRQEIGKRIAQEEREKVWQAGYDNRYGSMSVPRLEPSDKDNKAYENAKNRLAEISTTKKYEEYIAAGDLEGALEYALSVQNFNKDYLPLLRKQIEQDYQIFKETKSKQSYIDTKLDKFDVYDPTSGSTRMTIDEWMRNKNKLPTMTEGQSAHNSSFEPIETTGSGIEQAVESGIEQASVTVDITPSTWSGLPIPSAEEIKTIVEEGTGTVESVAETWMGYTKDELAAMGQQQQQMIEQQALQQRAIEYSKRFSQVLSQEQLDAINKNTAALYQNTESTDENSSVTSGYTDIEDAIIDELMSGQFGNWNELTPEQQRALIATESRLHPIENRDNSKSPQHKYIDYDSIVDGESLVRGVANHEQRQTIEEAEKLRKGIFDSFGMYYEAYKSYGGFTQPMDEVFGRMRFDYGDGQHFDGKEFLEKTEEEQTAFFINLISNGMLGSFQKAWEQEFNDSNKILGKEAREYATNMALGVLPWSTGIVGDIEPRSSEYVDPNSLPPGVSFSATPFSKEHIQRLEASANLWASILEESASTVEEASDSLDEAVDGSSSETSGESTSQSHTPTPQGSATEENTKAIHSLEDVLTTGLLKDAADFNTLEELLTGEGSLYGSDAAYLKGLKGMDKIEDMTLRRDFLIDLQKQMSEIKVEDLDESAQKIFRQLEIEVENRLAQISTDIQEYVDEWTSITKELATYDIQDALEIKNRRVSGLGSVDDYSVEDIEDWIDELLASSENLRDFQEVTNASTEELAEFIGQVTDDADAAKLTEYYLAMENLETKRMTGVRYDENGTLLTGETYDSTRIKNAIESSGFSIELKTTIASVAAENGNADAWVNFITNMTEKGYSDKIVMSLMTKMDFSVANGQDIYDQITKWETNGYLDAVQLQIEVQADLSAVTTALDELSKTGNVSGATLIRLVNEVNPAFADLAGNAYDLKEALEDYQEELETMAQTAERALNDVEGLEVLERLEDGLDIDEIEDVFQDLEDYVNRDLELDINLKIENMEDVDRLTEDLIDLRSTVTGIGDDYQIALSDIPGYVEQYGREILEGMTYVDGETVQLNQETVDQIIAGEYAKRDAALQAQIDVMEAQRQMHLQKANAYKTANDGLIQLAKDVWANEITGEQQVRDRIGEIEGDKVEAVQNAQSQFSLFSKQSTESMLDNETLIGNANRDVNRANAINTSRALQSMAKNYNEYASGVLTAYSAIGRAAKNAADGLPVDEKVPPIKVSGSSYSGVSAEVGQAKGGEGTVSEAVDIPTGNWTTQDKVTIAQMIAEQIKANNAAIAIEESAAEELLNGIAVLQAFMGAPNELPSQTGKDKSGGGGGGGKLDTKKKNDLDLDKYEKVDTLLDSIDSKLEEIETKQEDLVGPDKIQSIKEEIDLYRQQIPVLEEKKKIQEDELAEFKNSLSNVGIEFDEQGFITNYHDKYIELYEQYSAYVDAYNASTDEATRERLGSLIELSEQAMDKLNDEVSEYDDLLAKEIPATEQEILESMENIEEAGFEMFNTFIEGIENLHELNETMSELDGIMTGLDEDNPFRALTASASLFDKTVSSGSLEQMKALGEELASQADLLANGDASGWVGDDNAQFLETTQEYMSGLVDEINRYQEAAKEIEDNVIEAMEYQAELMDERIEKYDHINEQLEHQQKIIEMMRGEDAYQELNQVYDAMATANAAKMMELKAKEYQFQQLADSYADKDSESYKKAMELVYETQSEIDSLVEESIELTQQKFENMINETTDKFAESLVGSSDLDWMEEEWELIGRNAEQYLDAVNSAYEVQKLQGRYVQMLDDATDPGVQREITKQMNEQLAILREKDKLSQYDVDYANAQLEILQKRIALEDAQRNKNQMRLKRDAQGNYSYVYTADENAIAEAQQALADAENNAYNLSKENIITQQENAMSAISSANSLIRDIMNNRSLNDTEREERVNSVYESLREYLGGISEQLSTSESNIIQDYIDAIDSIDPANRGKGLLGDVFGVDKRFDTELSDRLQALEMASYKESELYAGLTAAQEEWNNKSSEILESAGDDFASFGENINSAYESVDALVGGMSDFFNEISKNNQKLIESQARVDEYTVSLEGLTNIMSKLYDYASGEYKELISMNIYNTFNGDNPGDPDKFDTGGYTGAWSGGSGKLAVLHSKEIVLNAEDTANILKTVEMVREMTNSMKQGVFEAFGSSMFDSVHSKGDGDPDVSVCINAEFPNAYSAEEIKGAFMDLNEQAIQYLYKNR